MTLELYFQNISTESNSLRYGDLAKLSGLTDSEVSSMGRQWASVPVERRRMVIERLVTMAENNIDLDFTSVFKHSLGDEDPIVRSLGVNGLWESNDRKLVTPLIALLREDSHKDVRASAAVALGKFGALAQGGKLLSRDGERIKEMLLSLLEETDEDPDVWRRVLEAAAVFNTSRVRELIGNAYTSEELRLRISAIFAMGKTADPAWLPTLINGVGDDDSAIRYESAIALGELAEEEAVPHLVRLIKDYDTQVQLASIKSMGAIGGQLATRTLQKCLRSNDDSIQEAAEVALRDIGVEDDQWGSASNVHTVSKKEGA